MRKELEDRAELNLDVFQNQISLLAEKSNLLKYLLECANLEDVLFEELQQNLSIECFSAFIRFEYARDYASQEDLQEKQDEIYKKYIEQGGVNESFEIEKERYFSKGQKYKRKENDLNRIELTPTYKLLDKIKIDMADYRNAPNEPVEAAKSVFRNIACLNILLRNDAIEALIEDESSCFGNRGIDRMKMWKKSKRIFNNALMKYKKELEEPCTSLEQAQAELAEVLAQKNFYDFILCERTEKLEQFLNTRLNGSKPKVVVTLIRALSHPKVGMIIIPTTLTPLINAIRDEFNVDVSSKRNDSFYRPFNDSSAQYSKEIENLAHLIVNYFSL